MVKKKIATVLLSLSSLTAFSGNNLPTVSEVKLSTPTVETLEETTGSDAQYAYPVALSCIGTLDENLNPVCNYLSFNRLINKNYFIWAPKGKEIIYADKTMNGPTAWNWSAPGAQIGVTTQNASMTYNELGHYEFPTLTATTANGTSSYTAEGELLVSGKAEITTANCRKWGETYMVGRLPLKGADESDAGNLGGTNSAGMTGYGNFFMTAHANAHMTGVNVYLAYKPTKYKEGAELLLRIWYPLENENGMNFTGLPIEVVSLPFSEIRDAKEGELPVKDAAVAEFVFEKPLQIWDKPMFFVTVEGFSDDPSTEDFCMLTEVMGQTIPTEQMSNIFAHNSFVNYMNSGYTLPINYFGAAPGASFMICPVIDNQDGDSGVTENTIESSKTSVSVSNGCVTVKNPEATSFNVVNIAGTTVASKSSNDGIAEFSLTKGIYIIQVMKKNQQIDVNKIMVK